MTPGATNTEGTFESTDRLNIFFRSWRPIGKPRGVVVVVPGFNAHSGYYSWVAERLVAAGSRCTRWTSAAAASRRANGSSSKSSTIMSAMWRLRDLARSREPGLPVFLLGHSAGGVVSVSLLEHQTALAGLICESFAFQLPAPDIALAVLKGLGHIAPHATYCI